MLILPVGTIRHILKGHHNYRQSLKKLFLQSTQQSTAFCGWRFSHKGTHLAVFKISS